MTFSFFIKVLRQLDWKHISSFLAVLSIPAVIPKIIDRLLALPADAARAYWRACTAWCTGRTDHEIAKLRARKRLAQAERHAKLAPVRPPSR